MQHAERHAADLHRVALGEEARRRHRARRDAVIGALFLEAQQHRAVGLVRPFDRHAELLGELGRAARMVDMAMSDTIFSTFTPFLAIASRMSGRSPPGSTTAPAIVASFQTRLQFCWNGVTGMTLILRGMRCFSMVQDQAQMEALRAKVNRRRGPTSQEEPIVRPLPTRRDARRPSPPCWRSENRSAPPSAARSWRRAHAALPAAPVDPGGGQAEAVGLGVVVEQALRGVQDVAGLDAALAELRQHIGEIAGFGL